MPQNEWYVHIQGETFGPISIDVIQILLRQNRLNFADFVWTPGCDRWMRISEINGFATMMPPYPAVEPPRASAPAPVVSAVTAAPVTMPQATAPVAAPAENRWTEFPGAQPVASPWMEVAPVAPMQAAPSYNYESRPAPVAPAPQPQAVQEIAPTPPPVATPAPTPAPRDNVIPMPQAKTGPAAPPRQQRVQPMPPPTSVAASIRRYPRVRIQAIVTIEGFGSYPAVDLSEAGVFIEAATPIPLGSTIKLNIQAGAFNRPLDMTGLVIREGLSEDGLNGFAIQFTRVNPVHRRAIQDYVRTQVGS